MSKHTPGPWVAQPDPHSNPGEWVIGVANGPVDYVAVCNERDALLISAAPDLLEALQRLNSATRRYMEERPESDAEWASDGPSVLSIVDAAIAKATGGDA